MSSEVIVKTMNGDSHTFELDANFTVLDLKNSIAEKLGHPVTKQALLKGGEVLKNNAATLHECFGTESYEVTLLSKKELELEENFETNASNPSELQAQYPSIGAQDKITVSNGVLIKSGEAKGNIIYRPEADGDLTRIVYKIRITCGRDRYNVGLGCLVCPPDKEGNLTSRGSSTRFCFHPGMGGGMFRIEGTGGHFNKNIGFTPPSAPEKAGDPVEGTKFTIELNKSGDHKVTLTHPQDDKSFTSEWTDASLWNSDSPPSFGIYDGDVEARGSNVYYTNFSVKAE